MNRELGLMLDNGFLVRDAGWRCVADVMSSFHGFDTCQVYGVIVDVETLSQVYPPTQLMDNMGTGKTSPLLG